MIGKKPAKSPGKGFRGTLNYLMRGSKDGSEPDRVSFYEFRNLAAQHPDNVPQEMRLTALLGRTDKPVYHCTISWHPDEAPSNEIMIAAADRLCRDLGLHEHQAFYVGHDDKNHRHIHILVNRVHPATHKSWDHRNDYARIEKSIAGQSRELGYIPVPGKHNGLLNKEAGARGGAKDGEYQRNRRLGAKPPRRQLSLDRIGELAPLLSPLFEQAQNWGQLERALAAHGISLERKGQGLILVDGDGTMKLSQLGRQIRYADLKKRFGDYEPSAAGAAAGTDAPARTAPPRQRRKFSPDGRPLDNEDEGDGEIGAPQRGPQSSPPPQKREWQPGPAPKQRPFAPTPGGQHPPARPPVRHPPAGGRQPSPGRTFTPATPHPAQHQARPQPPSSQKPAFKPRLLTGLDILRAVIGPVKSWQQLENALQSRGYSLSGAGKTPLARRGPTVIRIQDLLEQPPEALDQALGSSYASYLETKPEPEPAQSATTPAPRAVPPPPALQNALPEETQRAVDGVLHLNRQRRQKGIFEDLPKTLDHLFSGNTPPLISKLDIAFALHKLGLITDENLKTSLQNAAMEKASTPPKPAPNLEPAREEEWDRELS